MTSAAKSNPSTGLSKTAAAGIVAGVLGASMLLGMRNAPAPFHPGIRRWYKRLAKPSYTPPDPVFGGAWPLLSTSFAVGGYRLLRAPSSPARNVAAGLWLANAGMIGGWTEIFFRRHDLNASTAAAGAMAVGTGAYVVTAWKVDRVAAATAVPLVAWLGFATLLTERIRERNPAFDGVRDSRSPNPSLD
ncbi:TspO/MBR family protein [Sphingomonas sp. M1-B02]|uniref:TspO/MBR family protein n=1 Tax=Sphingomonas sp. M1-B02 TaxID=3114300 RepID=UPI0022408B04|nr:TspO/MBR family protein [Sphingomonas sp. S6-11]UZK65614.1 tryptophan-rich sensory protein [Sphingomonas sp. S6-11]